MASPDFTAFRPIDVTNLKSGAAYRLVRADSVAPTAARLDEIAAICNQPAVYAFLFRDRLAGAPYPVENAREFLAWAADGWRDGTQFVFLVVDAAGAVCAAADIKSADVDGAETGYWASAAHAGVMTPAFGALCDAARAAGYRRLFAWVRTENARSIAVLERNAFVRDAAGGETGPPARFLYRRAFAEA